MTFEQIKRRRFLALAAWCLATALVCERVQFVESKSIHYRFTFEAFGKPHKGDYVRVPVQQPLIDEGRKTHLTKQIVCVAGDVLTFDGNAHFCNGVEIDTINVRRMMDGTPLPIFNWNGPIPKGKVYLHGSHPRSFDSRYIGFFNLADASKVWAIF